MQGKQNVMHFSWKRPYRNKEIFVINKGGCQFANNPLETFLININTIASHFFCIPECYLSRDEEEMQGFKQKRCLSSNVYFQQQNINLSKCSSF